jgi:hypothetical protein
MGALEKGCAGIHYPTSFHGCDSVRGISDMVIDVDSVVSWYGNALVAYFVLLGLCPDEAR